MWDIQSTPEWHRLTLQQQFFVQAFALSGNAHDAVRGAYPGVSERNIARMAYSVPRSARVAAVLKLWNGASPKPIKKRTTKMSEPTGTWDCVLATPEMASDFVKWAQNPMIDPKDRADGTKKRNPTNLVFAITKDGHPVSFASVSAAVLLHFLVFAPESPAADRKHSMAMLTDAVSHFAVSMGIREILTLSKEKYKVAQHALKTLGFDLDTRQVLRLDLNKTLDSVAPVAASTAEAVDVSA